MENASKALIMAAGVLIGVLVLSLAAFLFMDFGARSKDVYAQVEHNQLTEYNAQYTIYADRNDLTIYDVVNLLNLAKQNNDNYQDSNTFDSEYKVTVILSGNSLINSSNGQDFSIEKKQNLISTYNTVGSNGELLTRFECTRNNFS